MIHGEKLIKNFDSARAVDELTISVEKGTIYGLLGSNGAGKTTLLKILAGIYKADVGCVTVDDSQLYENTELKNKVLFIPDQPYFFQQTTIIHMASFYASIYPKWNEQRFQQLLKHFALNPKQKLHRMSKGMQRQASFLLTLSTMPDVLILDEPFDGLDPVVRQQIKNVLFQDVAERQLTIIVSSHNLREMEDFCDAVAIMHKGKLLFSRDLQQLKTDIHKLQIAFSAEAPKLLIEQLKPLHVETRGSVQLCIVRGNEREITALVQQYNPAIFDVLPLTLEEVFMYEMEGVGYEIRNIIVE